MAQTAQKNLQGLLDLVLFVEEMAASVHGQKTEEGIFATLKTGFRKTGRYNSSILLLSPDRSHLRIAYTTISDAYIRAAEKAAQRFISSFSFPVRATPRVKALLSEGKTIHAPTHDFTREILPERIGRLVTPILKLKSEHSILTPLYQGHSLIGIFGMTANELTDGLIPSVKNLAMHVGHALERAAENKKQQQTEAWLGESEKRLWASEHSLRIFSRKILKAREDEAKKISADLHDETGSMAVALGSHLEIADHEISEGEYEKAQSSIRQTKAILQSHLNGLRRLAVRLRPPNLEFVGLPGSLRLLFGDIEKQSGLRIHFRILGQECGLEENAAIVLYRIAQEAMNNTLRHARAKSVRVRLRFSPSEVELSLSDDGCGFNASRIWDPAFCARIGLRGMKERAQLMDGIFQIESAPGKGCCVRVRLPVDNPSNSIEKTFSRSHRGNSPHHRR